jgi:RNA-directed DNA polymerase
VLARQPAPHGILEGDIRACFDGIRHDWFWAPIPLETAMPQKWLKAGGMEKPVLSPTATGVPQGGSASPGMANRTLDGLEKQLNAHSPPHTKRAQRATVHLVRDWDDCLMTGSAYALREHEGNPLVAQFRGERGLELSPTTPPRTASEDGFDFLGQPLRK